MRCPATLKPGFTGAIAFVEKNGDKIWEELCDTFPTGRKLTLAEAATQLDTLKGYAPRVQRNYLAAVLKAVYAQYEERPKDFPHPPFVKPGKNLVNFTL